MKTAGIIGLGLIGGSLAKCLRPKCGFEKIIGFDQHLKSLKTAMEEGVIDRFTTEIDAAFSECDIVIICSPVDTIGHYVRKLAPFLKEGAIVTDVGSTKKSVMAQAAGVKSVNFIGGHPMAGSEQAGYAASKLYLFENACYVLTPQAGTPPEALRELVQLVEQIGALPVVMDAEQHDRAVSAISHGPHVIASALVNTAKALAENNENISLLAAGGFKDFTRIASSDPCLWNAIAMDNKEEILNMLTRFKAEISAFERELSKDSGELTPLFDKAKQYRDSFVDRRSHPFGREFSINVDVEDTPGMIAKVATLLSLYDINIKNIGILNNREYENGILQIIFDRQDSKEKSISLLKSMNFTVFNG